MKTQLITVLAALAFAPTASAQDTALARQVEIRRTANGVPHILAQNFNAAGYALGYLQLEDYGVVVPMTLLRARAGMARVFGRDSIESDFRNIQGWQHAAASYPKLDADTRDVYDGFAAGVNAYMRLHPTEFPGLPSAFTGIDALATDIQGPSTSAARRLLARIGAAVGPRVVEDPNEGSNAWAFAPSRTKSGKAILLRNPHLNWNAGYYEAHLTVPGKIDFYGDFRIGGPFRTIGGFNAKLGWATTNNAPDNDEVYALTADTAVPDHVLFDGVSIPLRREMITVAFKNGNALGLDTREVLSTSLGPVIHRGNGKVYVNHSAGANEWRLGQMWLRAMRAQNLAEWKDAMRMLAKSSSNFTYADAAGNILYIWYGQVPRLPHAPGGDTVAIEASSSKDVWTTLVPFDSLPQLLNPKGGYTHNENNSFHFTNLNAVLPASAFPANFQQPSLSLRAQLGLQMVSGKDKLSLEDVITRKHNPHMLLADRVKNDLLAAVRATNPIGDVAAAVDVLSKWDNSAAIDSRGGVLFEAWWNRYAADTRTEPFAKPWSVDDPTNTPAGLASADRAVTAFSWAVDEIKKRYGSFDVAWGAVYRVRRGAVDVPVNGCPGQLGCFRVLSYRPNDDGKRAAAVGDGWVLAVEFDKVPRAFSVLAYGESSKPDSPYYADQAAMFAAGKLKRVAFTQSDIKRQAIITYHPGIER
jgi:acyl-homoserine-lactone acylase